jgi:hypothetical protein
MSYLPGTPPPWRPLATLPPWITKPWFEAGDGLFVWVVGPYDGWTLEHQSGPRPRGGRQRVCYVDVIPDPGHPGMGIVQALGRNGHRTETMELAKAHDVAIATALDMLGAKRSGDTQPELAGSPS